MSLNEFWLFLERRRCDQMFTFCRTKWFCLKFYCTAPLGTHRILVGTYDEIVLYKTTCRDWLRSFKNDEFNLGTFCKTKKVSTGRIGGTV